MHVVQYKNLVRGLLEPYKNISLRSFKEISRFVGAILYDVRRMPIERYGKKLLLLSLKSEGSNANPTYNQHEFGRNDKMPLLLSLKLWDTRQGG